LGGGGGGGCNLGVNCLVASHPMGVRRVVASGGIAESTLLVGGGGGDSAALCALPRKLTSGCDSAAVGPSAPSQPADIPPHDCHNTPNTHHRRPPSKKTPAPPSGGPPKKT